MKAVLEKIGRYKKIIIALVAVVAVALAASALISNAKEKQKALLAEMSKPETGQIERRNLVESISATGTVTSTASKSVVADVTGVDVLEVKVEVGDTVAEGDVLCMLDTEELELDLADARTALKAAQESSSLQVSAAERSLSDAQQSRNLNLENSDITVAKAWNDYMTALTKLEEAEEDYQEAQAETLSKKAEYDFCKAKLDEAEGTVNDMTPDYGSNSTYYDNEFQKTAGELKNYIAGQGLATISGAMDRVYLSNPNLQSYSAGSLVDSASMTTEQAAAIDNYLGTLKGYQSVYYTEKTVNTEYVELKAELEQWQQKYETAKQQEATCEATYKSMINEVDAYLVIYKQNVKQKEIDSASLDSNVAQKENSLASTQNSTMTTGSSEKKQIRQYEDKIAACTVTAPMKGVITAVNVEAGDSYQGTTIVTIEDTSAFEVSVEISEYDINKVEIGQRVVIKTNATGEEELQGKVKEIAPRATTGSSEITYAVIISIDTPCDELKMDMTAKVSIILEDKDNVLTVPYNAVQEDEEGSFYIEVVSENTGIQSSEQPEQEQPENAPSDENALSAEKVQMPENNAEMPEAQQNRRIYITKGIESDYYIEVISDEAEEGMEVVIPSTEGSEGFDIQMMMQRQGPMGGF